MMDRVNAAEFLKSLRKHKELSQKADLEGRDVHYKLKKIRSLLPDREYRVLVKRMVDGKSQSAIAREMKITRERVRQIEARGIERLEHFVNRSPHELPEVE